MRPMAKRPVGKIQIATYRPNPPRPAPPGVKTGADIFPTNKYPTRKAK